MTGRLGAALGALAFFIVLPSFADASDARNFLGVATGTVPSVNDPRIEVVAQQLESIHADCASSSHGAPIYDQLAFAHSELKVQQSLLGMLTDFVRIARAQCSKFDQATLVTLYLLERNSGASHGATVERLIKNPRPMVLKWSAQPVTRK